MTNQEIYNKVCDHLLTQMKKSEGKYDEERAPLNACLYRGPNGLKCAIGALIPDDKYDPKLEGLCGGDPEIRMAIGCTSDQRNLLIDLQTIHDENEPAQWEYKLWKLAGEYNLER